MVVSSFSWWTTTSANKLSTTTTTWSQRHHQQSSPQNNTRLSVAATSKNIINNKDNLTNNDLMINNNSNLGQGSELQLPSFAGRSKSGHLDFGNTNIFDDESWSLLSTIMLKIYIWSAHPPWGHSTLLVLTPSPQVAEQGPQVPMLHEPDPPWQGNSYSPSHNTIINMKKTSHLGGLLYHPHHPHLPKYIAHMTRSLYPTWAVSCINKRGSWWWHSSPRHTSSWCWS